MKGIQLTTLDLAIMVGYALFVIGYGLYHAKRKTSEEYFLAGRNMVWPIVGISLFAANISSSTLFGLAGDAYKTNTHVFNYEWLASVVLIFFAIFFLPFYLRSKVYTMPEYLERRYDKRSRYYFSFITVVGNVLIDTAAALYAGSIILKLLFPDIPSWVIITVLAFAAAAYTIPGGLNAVVQTEVVQAVLLILGSVVLTYYAFDKVGGWYGLIDGLNAKAAAGEFVNEKSGIVLNNANEVLSMVRPINDEFMPWTGLLLGAPILGFYFWANNQFMVQRVLGAKNLNHGRWGALFAGFLKLPVIFFMVLPGTCAILLFSGTDLSFLNFQLKDGTICTNLKDCPNATYPLLLFELLPKGLLGLVLAGLLAAMMSSISATFNSASTLVTMDFVDKLRPGLSSKQLVRTGQLVTLILVVLASAWAPQIERFASIWQYLQDVLGYIAPPVAATFIVGLFWRGANGNGSFYSLLFGLLFSIIALISRQLDLLPWLNEMHFLHRTFLLFVLCILINIVVSKTSGAPDWEHIKNFIWNKAVFDEETRELKDLPWYQNYRFLAVGLLIITALVVGFFW